MESDALNTLLAPFEARSVALSHDEIAERKRGISFGGELNRLQGIEPSAVDRRLEDLWCCGQVTREELVALVEHIAHRGLFRERTKEMPRDGR